MKVKRLLLVLAMVLVFCMPTQSVVAADCVNGYHEGYRVHANIGATTGGVHYYASGSHGYGQVTHSIDFKCVFCATYIQYYYGTHQYITGHIAGCGTSNSTCN